MDEIGLFAQPSSNHGLVVADKGFDCGLAVEMPDVRILATRQSRHVQETAVHEPLISRTTFMIMKHMRMIKTS